MRETLCQNRHKKKGSKGKGTDVNVLVREEGSGKKKNTQILDESPCHTPIQKELEIKKSALQKNQRAKLQPRKKSIGFYFKDVTNSRS